MIISKYTFFLTYKGEYYLYNSLSNALVKVDKETYVLLMHSRKENNHLDDIRDNAFLEMLSDKRFICNSDKDELLLYKSAIQSLREQRGFMHLTIAPTMDCCFNCFYCFEHNKVREYMSDDVMDAIVEYVNKQNTLKRIQLSWFGGEPLMAQDQMLSLYRKLKQSFSGDIASNIITTGFHIGESTVSLFKELEITSMQITLDGNKETHNRIKHTDGCTDAFNRVIENIAFITEKLPDLNVAIRVNITKQNATQFPALFFQLHALFANKNVTISPSIVKDKKHKGVITVSNQVFFTVKDFSDYVLSLFEKYGIHTQYLTYPGNELCECAIRDKMAISFDPGGYAYKCWEKIGDKQYAIGRLQKDGILSEINHVELNRELYGADPFSDPLCVKCKYLPLCNGGCPIERIQNEFEGCSYYTCTIVKGRIKKYLQNHIYLKQKGLSNNYIDPR